MEKGELKKRILIHVIIYVFTFFLLIITIKTWYINNILYSIQEKEIKSLNMFQYNKKITKEVKKEAKQIGFKKELINKLNKDKFFSSYYTLSFQPTCWLYDVSLNTLLLTDDYKQYSKKQFSIKDYDETIKHELIHYFLSYPEFKEKVFKIQDKIFLEGKSNKILNKYYWTKFDNDNKKELLKRLYSYSYSPMAILDIILWTPDYNPDNYSKDYVLKHFKEYKTNRKINVIREELITFYFQDITYGPIKTEYILEHKDVFNLYKMFFNNNLEKKN